MNEEYGLNKKKQEMVKVTLICLFLLGIIFPDLSVNGQSKKEKSIYKDGWIDLNKNGKLDPYENPKVPLEERIENLLAQMNLEEKTCQMVTLYGYGRVLKDDIPNEGWKNELWKDGVGSIDEHLNGFVGWGKAPSDNQYCWPASKHAWAMNEVQRFFIEETRLGIPTDFTNEGIRGIENYSATIFPTQLAIGQTWNKNLVEKIGDITGKEARILGYTNVYAPILDVARDQRWGRMEEVYGESPFLVAEMGIAMTKGLQNNNQVAATAKHFAIYSNNKGAREGLARVDPQISPRETENIHLYPFRRVIEEAGLLGVMSSYNDYDGIPIQSSYYYLTEKLRKEYGFKGYVVSDSDAVIYLYNKHKTAGTYKEAVLQSVKAGLNMRCTFRSPESFVEPLRELVKEGSLSEEIINDRVRDILRVKYMVGLFDHPYIENIKEADKIVNKKEHHEVALQASRESIVLLKNDSNLLPLDQKKIKNIAVCGPNADDAAYALTHYGPLTGEVITVLKGIKNKVGDGVNVTYTKGCDLVDANWPDSEILPEPLTEEEQAEIEKAVAQAKQADVAVVVVGGSQRTCGENKSRTNLTLPGRQLDLIKAIEKTGTPMIVTVISGRPLSINWTNKHVPAILQGFYPGAFGGQAIADILFGDYNPGGKLTVTVPKSVGQIPFNFPMKPNAQLDAWGQAGVDGKRARINGALYPFGYGLSYTTFKYSNLNIIPKVITPAQRVKVTFDITNTGDMAGEEVVQLYMNDVLSSLTTYEKNLRGFKRVKLLPGETKQVSFELLARDLELINERMERVVEPGDFKVMLGASSEDIKLSSTFKVVPNLQQYFQLVKGASNEKTVRYISASDNNNLISYIVDQDLSTSWESQKEGAYINFELADGAEPDDIQIAWGSGTKQQYNFEIQLSGGGGQFMTVYNGQSKGKTLDFEKYEFKGFPATDLRIIVKEHNGDQSSGIREIKLDEWKGIK